MKTKKWLALVLAMVMALSLLAGCGGKDNTPPEPAPEPAPAAPENSDPARDARACGWPQLETGHVRLYDHLVHGLRLVRQKI